MKRKQRKPIPKGRFTVYERLSQQIEEYAERNGWYSNAELIAHIRVAMFGAEGLEEEDWGHPIPSVAASGTGSSK